MIDIDIHEEGLERIALDLVATQKDIDRALASTLGKMASWLRTQSIRGIAKALKFPQKEIRRRLKTFRLRRAAGGKAITVWYGLDAMGMIHLDARQTATGVSAFGGRSVAHAFIANGQAGRNGPPSASNKQVFIRKGKSRLPLKKVTAELGDPAQTYIEDHLLGGNAFTEKFYEVFERELKWRQSK